MHAIYITGLLPLWGTANPDLPRYTYNALLLAFIVNYSLFTDRGWWSVLFDLFYIYFLPFIYAGRTLWFVTALFARNFKSKIIWENPQLINQPAKVIPQAHDTQASKAIVNAKESARITIYDRLARMILKYSLLWCLLILTVNSKLFLWFAVAVTALGASRAILNLWGLFSGGSSWVDKVETSLGNKITELTAQIDRWDGVSDPEVIRQAINGLKLYRSVFNFIAENTAILTSWAFTASIAISIPFYCYISILFACTYFGIAKVSGANLPLQEAFVDSLFMPFAWSALPPNLLIRFVAGLQATCVSIIGYNIMFRHIGNRLERITKAATKLRSPFQSDPLPAKISKAEVALTKRDAQGANPFGNGKYLGKKRKKR
jgi:hypothetical protein